MSGALPFLQSTKENSFIFLRKDFNQNVRTARLAAAGGITLKNNNIAKVQFRPKPDTRGAT